MLVYYNEFPGVCKVFFLLCWQIFLLGRGDWGFWRWVWGGGRGWRGLGGRVFGLRCVFECRVFRLSVFAYLRCGGRRGIGRLRGCGSGGGLDIVRFRCWRWGRVCTPGTGLGREGDLGGEGIPGAIGRLNQAEENQPCDQAVYDFPFSGHVKHHPFSSGRLKVESDGAPPVQSSGFIVTSFPFFCLNACFNPLFRPWRGV